MAQSSTEARISSIARGPIQFSPQSGGGSYLDVLKKYSIVVADTADFGLIAKYKPEDATTNPSLVLAGTQIAGYSVLFNDALEYGLTHGNTFEEQIDAALDKITVNFGLEILKIIPGRVSTEVDAKYSFDTELSVKKARRLIKLYEVNGIPRSRVYIKLAATWEGIQAARILEAEGIACNLTLLFSFAQAVACAQAGVSLISPFVGRILDWNKKNFPKKKFEGAEDPGVQSVTRIYSYFKKYGYKTVVMGASFRNSTEITELAGCDKITISPALLEELAAKKITWAGELPRKLIPGTTKSTDKKVAELTREAFSFMHNEDAMGVEKLAEGIRNFNKDTRKLEAMIAQRLKKRLTSSL